MLNDVRVYSTAAPAGWATPDQLVVRDGGIWKTVVQAHVRDGSAWKKVYEITQDAPATISPGGTPTNSGATVTWSAVPGSNVTYQLVMRPGVAGSVGLYPTADTWTPNLSLPVSGLAQDTTYTFTVKSRRPLNGGTYLESPESTAKLQLWTGHAAGNTQIGTGTSVTTPNHADTWDANARWGDYDGDVVQGYSGNSSPSKNGYGCVRYGASVYAQIVRDFGSAIADNAVVTDAKIVRIYRKTGGAGTPTIHVYPAYIDFSSPTKPDNVYSGTTFQAPVEGDYKDNFEFAHTDVGDRLMNWAQLWARTKPGTVPIHNGLLIFNTGGTGNDTAGYNGFCHFRGIVGTNDWDLKVWLSWNFDPKPADPARWL